MAKYNQNLEFKTIEKNGFFMSVKYIDIHTYNDALFKSNKPLKILMLADTKHQNMAVKNHIKSFRLWSNHRVSVFHPKVAQGFPLWYMNFFDALVFHYSIPIIFPTYLPGSLEERVKRYKGIKAVIMEDEYRYIDSYINRFNELKIDKESLMLAS